MGAVLDELRRVARTTCTPKAGAQQIMESGKFTEEEMKDGSMSFGLFPKLSLPQALEYDLVSIREDELEPS